VQHVTRACCICTCMRHAQKREQRGAQPARSELSGLLKPSKDYGRSGKPSFPVEETKT
jgi:hypothetical protein